MSEPRPADLEELYDADTLAAMERWRPRDAARDPEVAAWRKQAAARALVSAIGLGLREVFEPKPPDEAVEEIDVDQFGRDLPVTVYLVPGNPKASIALVRPWLFG